MKTAEKIIAVLFTAIAVSFNFWYMGLPVIILNAGLLISLFIWLTYKQAYSKRLNHLFVAGIILQFIHFMEEYFTGFHKKLPPVFNRPAWTDGQFLVFNGIWMLLFIAAAIGAARGIKLSYIIVWFFILIVGIGNGIMHTLLSVSQGGYFPGSVSALFLFAIGVWMIKKK